MSSKTESTSESLSLVVSEQGNGQRLDRYVAENVTQLSRSQLKQRLMRSVVNHKDAKISHILSTGDQIELELAVLPDIDLVPEDLQLDILFENQDVVVINKQAGLVVHPAVGNHSGTLVHGLLFHLNELKDQEFDDETRPGIVHRLDKDTSGVLIVAKNPAAHEFLALQFHERTTVKTYLAIAHGTVRFEKRSVAGFLHRDPKNRQRFMYDENTGKKASTDFQMLASKSGFCLLRVHPLTGRTHQIRVHARHIGLPLLGDPLYGKPVNGFTNTRLMLHAHHLEIVLPGEALPRRFSAPLPEDMIQVAQRLGFGDLTLSGA